jgi:hypothetical protein
MISAPHTKPAESNLVPALKLLNELQRIDKSVGIAPKLAHFAQTSASEHFSVDNVACEDFFHIAQFLIIC